MTTFNQSIVKDPSLASFGRKEISLAEVEMPGLMALRAEFGSSKPLKGAKITGSLHMTIQTAVLIETLEELGAQIRWCSCNVFSTQDHAAAAIAEKNTAAVFAWKGENLQEYWELTLMALSFPEGNGPHMIVDDGGDATMMVLEGAKLEKTFEETGKIVELPNAATEDEKQLHKILVKTL